jgi:hypothetical protein
MLDLSALTDFLKKIKTANPETKHFHTITDIPVLGTSFFLNPFQLEGMGWVLFRAGVLMSFAALPTQQSQVYKAILQTSGRFISLPLSFHLIGETRVLKPEFAFSKIQSKVENQLLFVLPRRICSFKN